MLRIVFGAIFYRIMKWRTLTAATLFLFASILTYAQESEGCKLRSSEFPSIRNLRLGLTRQQVIKRYPKINLANTGINAYLRPAISRPYPDVNEIRVGIANNKLVFFGIFYRRRVFWESINTFKDSFLNKLPVDIPMSHWTTAKDAVGSVATAHCADFSITLRLKASGDYSVEVERKGAAIELFMELGDKVLDDQKKFKP